MPEAISPNTPSRRAAMLGASGLALAGVLALASGPATGPNANAQLIALCDEFCRLERAWLAEIETKDEIEEIDGGWRAQRQGEIADYIEENPPTTLDGFRAIAYTAVLWAPDMWDGREPAGLHGVLNSALLRGLLGGVKP